ncbi:tetratricopeptide repeat protein [Methanoregula sp.]|uniref:tetratricopeptide repeat protein n=1 Tax=Methanoregula sp. TaxID=2052170 RepID=UPI002BBBA0DC|nr:tetratricopeptide repeat protein [Methanoregula sp.]HVP97267.1 tetratricopeptide repeat protein [Methanoregula sp.]
MDDAQTFFSEGVALYEKGDYKRALAAFDKAIAIDPGMAEVWNNRGLALIQTGNYREALVSVNKALSLNPSYEHARKAKKILLGLMQEPEASAGAPAASAPHAGPAGDPAAPQEKSSRGLTIAIVVVLMIAACGMVIVKDTQGSSGSILSVIIPTPVPTTVPTPLPTPVPTATPVPTPIIPIVPSSGVWVEVSYDQLFSGSVGTPGSQQQLAGSLQTKQNTSDQFYSIPMVNGGVVTASVNKNDGSGDNLTVNVYSDGTLVQSQSTTMPYGTLYVTATIPTVTPTLIVVNTTATA